MEDLSSCYFCGTAIEAPVREYPVVPEDVGGSDGPTVSLCPTCRRKHRAVVDAVVASVTDRDPDTASATVADDDGGSAGPDPSSGAESVGAAAASAQSDPAGEPGDGAPAGPDAETSDAPTGDEPGDEGTSDAPTGGEPGDGATDSGSPAPTGGGDQSDPAGGSGSGAGSGEHEDGGGPEPVFSDSTTAGADEAPDDDPEPVFSDSTPVGGGAGEVDPEGSVGESALDGDDPEGAEEPAVDLSTPPHSKVVRQLQNREFPVDREEIVAVATGAYGLSNREAEEALDGLVAGGILEEADGRLFRSGDRGPGGP